MKVLIYVRLKDTVLDPQGKAVLGGLRNLGFAEIENVKVGKMIELYISDVQPSDKTSEASAEELRGHIKEMCEKLLVNTVIEEFRFEVVK
ncbi:MAG: phosphoribosylformylglycinamidine synthase subunit PurS [Nitrospirae bacterium]|nr:phosphoribosylformylglycinamidine synthase subunit PurS [Nitrospirota bacterium]